MARVHRGSGPASAVAEQRLKSWGLQMDLAEGLEGRRGETRSENHTWASQTGFALSLPSPARSHASSQGQEARSVVTSAPSEAPVLQLPSSEELDIVSIETGDTEVSSLQSSACEELVEVITRVVAKLMIDWPGRETGASS